RYYHDIVADGSRYYVLDDYQRRFVLHPLHPQGFVAEQQSAGIFADYSFGGILLSGGRDLVSAARTSGKFLGEEVVEGTRCDKIQVRTSKVVYWIGQEDGLIRRTESELTPPMRIVESYTIVQIGG